MYPTPFIEFSTPLPAKPDHDTIRMKVGGSAAEKYACSETDLDVKRDPYCYVERKTQKIIAKLPRKLL